MILYTYPGAVKVFGWHAKSIAKGMLSIPLRVGMTQEEYSKLIAEIVRHMSPGGVREARDGYDMPCGYCGHFVNGPHAELGYKCMC